MDQKLKDPLMALSTHCKQSTTTVEDPWDLLAKIKSKTLTYGTTQNKQKHEDPVKKEKKELDCLLAQNKQRRND